MTIKEVEKYFKTVNLNDYDLGGFEIVEEDYKAIVDRVNSTGNSLKNVVNEYLFTIRETLDEDLFTVRVTLDEDLENEYE
jgi:hypothetical protein